MHTKHRNMLLFCKIIRSEHFNARYLVHIVLNRQLSGVLLSRFVSEGVYFEDAIVSKLGNLCFCI